ncbi:MAG TPA: magnesium transporter CorA family protein [Fimbriiglobus sp.]|jgi:magnesium transporter|nr:magnesium transporter CorA family protein [Fimbriiglobus sp.]
MIHVLRWDPATHAGRRLDPSELPSSHADLSGDEDTVWIDLENPTPEEEKRVFQQFLPVHPLTLEDVTKPRREPAEGAHLPKVEEFTDYLFVIVNPLPAGFGPPPNGDADLSPTESAPVRDLRARRNRPQLSAVMTHRVLVTHHYDPLPSVGEVLAYATRHGECARRGPDYLFHLILDRMVDEYTPVVEGIADRLDRLEDRMFRKPSREVLVLLLRMKRRVSFLRKTLILEREVLARLTRGEFELVDPREIAYYRNVYDHLVRYTELIESAREMVSDLMQSHLAAVSNRLNEIMKVLTMISTVVLPMTLIAGVFGMNFEENVWPDFKSRWGFPVAIAAMALTGIGAFVWFRRRGWL